MQQLAVAQALEHVLGVHAAHEHVLGLAAEQELVAQQQLAVERRHEVADDRGRQQRDLRQRPHGPPELGQALAHGVELVGVAPVGEHADGGGVALGDLGGGDVATWTTSSGERPNALTTSSTGAPRLAAAGVEGQLGRTGDVGVVGPDDDDRLARRSMAR